MKFSLLLVLVGMVVAASATEETLQFWPDTDRSGPQALSVYRVNLEADINGTIDYTTPALYGKLYAVAWQNDTASTINGTVYLNTTLPYVISIENCDMSGGNTTEYTRTGGSLQYFLSGPMTLQASDADANQTMNVWLYLER